MLFVADLPCTFKRLFPVEEAAPAATLVAVAGAAKGSLGVVLLKFVFLREDLAAV